MKRPVCVRCQIGMRAHRTGVILLETYQQGQPYKTWAADVYVCPVCGVQVVAGFSNNPTATNHPPHLIQSYIDTGIAHDTLYVEREHSNEPLNQIAQTDERVFEQVLPVETEVVDDMVRRWWSGIFVDQETGDQIETMLSVSMTDEGVDIDVWGLSDVIAASSETAYEIVERLLQSNRFSD